VAFSGGLVLSFLSALAINWSYSTQHDAVAEMPALSVRRPVEAVRALLRNRAWLVSFGVESVGWLLYLGALRLAPLSLVQGVGAAGIAALAVFSAHGHPRRLPVRQQAAVVAGMVGLVLLALSLLNSTQVDREPSPYAVAIWLGVLVAVSLVLTGARVRIARAPALGLAAGLLFAAGDILSKLGVFGGAWVVAFAPLLVVYALGTGLLQQAFQAGGALTTAGLATLATNAIPIVSGFVLFAERVPAGWRGIVQMLGFASLIGSAVLLARRPPAQPA
jgi:drug/metabolite transporter (DMT)-like permease